VYVLESVHTLYVRHSVFLDLINAQCVVQIAKLKEAGITLINE